MAGQGLRTERAGGTARLIFDSGAARGLTEPLLAELTAAFDRAAADPAIERIELRGRDNIFLRGVDVSFFASCLKAGDVERILGFTRAAHALLASISQCDKPVIAWVEGGAWGAGVELALACRRIVAAPTAKFALPETSLGIYPGLGGTQRAPRRIGVGLAKWMIYTGAVVPAARALEIGLIDALGDADEPRREKLSPRFAALEEFFAGRPVATLLDPSFEPPRDPSLARAWIQTRNRPATALRLAETVIDRGSRVSLAEGLQIEYAHLREVFSTEAARAALK